MLFARNEKGELVTVRNKIDSSLFQEQTFFCPDCQQPLILKAGAKKKPHFSHIRRIECDSFSKGETEQHLIGKEQLYKLFLLAKQNIVIEKYFKQIAQRADLFIQTSKKNYVIEFQCSIVPIDLILNRTEGYKKLQLPCLWILSYDLIKKKQFAVLQVSDFLLFFTSFSYSFFPSILFFDTNTNKYNRVYILSSISPNHTLAIVRSSNTLEVEKTLQIHSTLINNWYTKNVQSRMWIHRKLTKWKRIRLIAYQRNMSISLYPIEVFLPVPSSIVLHAPLEIWQLQIYLELIEPLRVGEELYFSEIYLVIQNNPYVFQKRNFLYKTPSKEEVVCHYFEQLVFLGYFKKEKTSYRLLKPFQIPKNVEDGASRCAELSRRIIEYNIFKSKEI